MGSEVESWIQDCLQVLSLCWCTMPLRYGMWTQKSDIPLQFAAKKVERILHTCNSILHFLYTVLSLEVLVCVYKTAGNGQPGAIAHNPLSSAIKTKTLMIK